MMDARQPRQSRRHQSPAEITDMTIAVTQDRTSAVVPESHVVRMLALTRRLRVAIHQIEDDYRALNDAGLIQMRPGLQELQSIPVLLEMAGESAGELLGLAEGMDNAF